MDKISLGGYSKHSHESTTNTRMLWIGKDVRNDTEKTVAVVRPTKAPTNGQPVELATASVMVGVHEECHKETPSQTFVPNCNDSTPFSCPLDPMTCQRCMKYASTVQPLVKRLKHLMDKPADLVNILELKRDLVDLDNCSFMTLMTQLLRSFPPELRSCVSHWRFTYVWVQFFLINQSLFAIVICL